MASPTQSPTAESQRPAWLVPLLVFGGVAGSVSVTGSILMFVLSLFSGSSSEQPPGPTVAQQTAAPSAAEPSRPPEAPAPSQPMPPAAASQAMPAPTTNTAPTLQQPQPQSSNPASNPAPPPPAVDIAAVMKAKAKRLDIGDFVTITLPGEAKNFALDPASGRLAIVGPWEDQVGFLSADDLTNGSDSNKLRLVSLVGQPLAVAYVPRQSGGAFAVGTREPDGVTFLDAESLKPLKTVAVKFAGVLAASQNAAIPHVYLTFVGTAERGRAKLGVARIDAERLEMDAQWENREFRHISVSPDGQFIYTLPNNSGSDLTRSLPRAPEQDGSGGFWDNDVSRLGRVPTRYYIDPRGAIIAAGVNVYSADVTQLLMELDYDPLAIMEKQPWMAGLRQFDLVIGSKNDGRAVAELELPGEFLIPDEKIRKRGVTPRQETKVHPAAFAQLFADDQRSRFVLGTRHQVVSLPLDKLELPDEPYLSLATTPPQTAIVDNTYEVSLATLSGSPEVELIKVPEGMTVEDGMLRWTPKDGDVGSLDVRVELKDGGVTHDEAWQIEVGQPKLDLPFMAEGCAPSEDGERVVVWGIEWSMGKASEKLNSQVALVDLATRKLLAARKLDFRVARVEIGKHAVYVPAQPPQYSKEPGPLAKLALDDLRDLGVMNLEHAFLTTVADRYLICFDGRERFSRYTLPELRLVETLPIPGRSSYEPIPLPRKLADGWLLDGVIWDEGLDKARWLIEPSGFERDLSAFRESTDHAFRGYAFDVPGTTGARRREDDVLAFNFSPHIPARLTLRKTMPDRRTQQGSSSGEIHLDFVGRLSKDVVRSVTLRNGLWQKAPLAAGSHVVTTPDQVLVTHYGDVFVLPAVGSDGPIPVPFRIVPKQSTFVLSATRPTKVAYKAEGAAKFELTFQQMGSQPPEKLESIDGEFEVDLRDSIPELARRLGSLMRGNSRYDAQGKTRYEGYAIMVRDSFRQIVGKNPSGIPLLVKAEVQAYNATGRAVRLPHTYLIDIPEREFEQYQTGVPPRVASNPTRPTRPESAKTRTSPPRRAADTTSDKQTAVDYSQAFRQRLGTSGEKLDLDQLKADVAAADAKFLDGLSESKVVASAPRTWTDAKGRTLLASFVEQDGEVVVVTDERKRTLRIPLEQLSDADKQWVQSRASGTQAVDYPSPALSLRTLGVAIGTHHDTHQSYPPKALVTEDGAALLSWRVLLLQQLGYESLAAAFRYDESWDSEHNRQLVPLMPAVFRGDTEVAASGKTPYVAVFSQTGTISDRYVTRTSDIKDPSNQTLLLTEVMPTVAPAWTQPADPSVSLVSRFDRILRFREDRVIVCFADASVSTLPIGTAELEWKKLISIRDGQSVEAVIEPVPNVSNP